VYDIIVVSLEKGELSTMKVLFLDFDGVLNGEWHGNPEHLTTHVHSDRIDRYYQNKHETQMYIKSVLQKYNVGSLKLDCVLDLDPEKVKLLNKIVDKTDCKIVFSTSWRGCGVENLTLYLCMNHFLFPNSCIDRTPFMDDRGEEIAHWLKGKDVEKYAILDDDFFDIADYHPSENFFHIKGLNHNDVDGIIEFLNS